MSSIRPAALADRLETDSKPFVLDIRPEASYGTGAIEQSHNIPVYNDLRSGDETAFRSRLDELPTEKDVVVVCKMGIVAKRATKILQDEGYDAATLAGGMHGWNGYQNNSLSYKLRSLWWRVF